MPRWKFLPLAASGVLLVIGVGSVIRPTSATQDDENWGRSMPVVNADIFDQIGLHVWRFAAHPKAKKATIRLTQEGNAEDLRMVREFPQGNVGDRQLLIVVDFGRSVESESRKVRISFRIEGNSSAAVSTVDKPVRASPTSIHATHMAKLMDRNSLMQFREGVQGQADHTFAELFLEVE